MTISEFLTNFDIFRSPIFLRMNSSYKISTNIGIFLSFVIYGILIYAFSENDIFYKQSPKIITQTDIAKSRPEISPKGQFFAIAITDFDGTPFNDPTVFSISVYKQEFSGPDYNFTTKSYHICNESDMKKPQDLSDLVLNDNFCLDDPNFSIQGSFSEVVVSFFTIKVLLCKNSAENNNSCKSYEEISSILKGKYFNLMFNANSIELKNPTNPFQRSNQALFQKIDPKMNKEVNIYLQKVLIDTDDGIIFSNKKVKEGFQIERKENDFSSVNLEETDIEIASFTFYSSEKILTIQRNYQTLSEAFAILGGLYSFLFIMGNIFSSIDTKIFLTTSILNDLYIFPKESKNIVGEKKNTELELVKTENININQKELGKKDGFKVATNIDMKSTIKYPTVIKKKTEEDQESEINLNNEKQSSLINRKLEKKVLKDDSIVMESHSEKNIDKKNEDSSKNSILQKSLFLSSPSPTKKSFFRWRSKRKNNELNDNQWEAFQNIEKDQAISFNFLEYLKLQIKKITNCFKLTAKEKLFENAEKLFNEEINIVQILRKIQYIEKLKYLLLDKKQLLLLSLLEKPIINLENQERLDHLSIFLPNEKKDLKEAFEHYKKLEKTENKESLDGKLFNLIDKRIKKILIG